MGLDKVFAVVDGYKTYIIAGVTVLVALVGHFWGPLNMAGGTIPKESWNDVWKAIQAGGALAALRHGISKGGTPS